MAIDDIFQPGVADRRPEGRQGVHLPGVRIDDRGVMVFPTGLVLLAAAVVIDGEQHRAARSRRSAEPHRRAAAVRPDLDHRGPATAHPAASAAAYRASPSSGGMNPFAASA